jgi:hypothetical protein
MQEECSLNTVLNKENLSRSVTNLLYALDACSLDNLNPLEELCLVVVMILILKMK